MSGGSDPPQSPFPRSSTFGARPDRQRELRPSIGVLQRRVPHGSPGCETAIDSDTPRAASRLAASFLIWVTGPLTVSQIDDVGQVSSRGGCRPGSEFAQDVLVLCPVICRSRGQRGVMFPGVSKWKRAGSAKRRGLGRDAGRCGRRSLAGGVGLAAVAGDLQVPSMTVKRAPALLKRSRSWTPSTVAGVTYPARGAAMEAIARAASPTSVAVDL